MSFKDARAIRDELEVTQTKLRLAELESCGLESARQQASRRFLELEHDRSELQARQQALAQRAETLKKRVRTQSLPAGSILYATPEFRLVTAASTAASTYFLFSAVIHSPLLALIDVVLCLLFAIPLVLLFQHWQGLEEE